MLVINMYLDNMEGDILKKNNSRMIKYLLRS